jgi:hypothetical protein
MPKNNVSDPITDQEVAFAHLIMSGTMNDRRAAEAVGLNPETAAYTKAKPRVRAYMTEHRAAVTERLVDQEADGLRKLNLGRDQILTRLWELATLSHEVTRGSIAGQVKAIAMIVAIEGLNPSAPTNGRRLAPSGTQPAAPEWRHTERNEPQKPGDPMAAAKTPPAAPQVPKPGPSSEAALKMANEVLSSNLAWNQLRVANPFINPEKPNRPSGTSSVFDAVLDQVNSLRLPFSQEKGFSGQSRGSR